MQQTSYNQSSQENNNFFPPLRGDQRGVFIGKTGSGKSYTARYMLKLMRQAGWRVVIIDPKKDWQGKQDEKRPYGEKKKGGTIDNPVLVQEFDPTLKVQIIHPVVWNKGLAAFLMQIMYTGNTVIYFDEGTQLVNANFVPMEFMVVVTQGRSVNVAVWYGTQRPVGIPRIIKDQASFILLFRVTDPEDIQVVKAYMSAWNMEDENFSTPLDWYWFWYYEEHMEKPILVRPLTIKSAA